MRSWAGRMRFARGACFTFPLPSPPPRPWIFHGFGRDRAGALAVVCRSKLPPPLLAFASIHASLSNGCLVCGANRVQVHGRRHAAGCGCSLRRLRLRESVGGRGGRWLFLLGAGGPSAAA
eukprot:4281600-Pyramimonas_sp.AAC.1